MTRVNSISVLHDKKEKFDPHYGAGNKGLFCSRFDLISPQSKGERSHAPKNPYTGCCRGRDHIVRPKGNELQALDTCTLTIAIGYLFLDDPIRETSNLLCRVSGFAELACMSNKACTTNKKTVILKNISCRLLFFLSAFL